MTTGAEKTNLRAVALARRASCRPESGIRMAGHLLATTLIRHGAVVSGFWPLDGEIDIRPLLVALLGRGHIVVLPETPPRGRPLLFRHWRPGTPMLRERFGTMRPDGPFGVPDVLLVPLLAFDARCNRLGYGGGYYDRTIEALAVSAPERAGQRGIRTIGCAFALQQVDAVPVLPHDAPLDAIATEAGVILRPES
jgi:5-formyltetrahydrofolate cyclo-ligase